MSSPNNKSTRSFHLDDDTSPRMPSSMKHHDASMFSPTCVSMMKSPSLLGGTEKQTAVDTAKAKTTPTSLFVKPSKRESKKLLDEVLMFQQQHYNLSDDEANEEHEKVEAKAEFMKSPLHMPESLEQPQEEEEELPEGLNLPSFGDEDGGCKRRRCGPKLAPVASRPPRYETLFAHQKRAKCLFDPDELTQITSSPSMFSPRKSLMLPDMGFSW